MRAAVRTGEQIAIDARVDPKRSVTEIIANEMTMLGSRAGAGGSSSGAAVSVALGLAVAGLGPVSLPPRL